MDLSTENRNRHLNRNVRPGVMGLCFGVVMGLCFGVAMGLCFGVAMGLCFGVVDGIPIHASPNTPSLLTHQPSPRFPVRFQVPTRFINTL